MKVTDISSGHFVFTPVSGQPVFFATLKEAIEGAGYEIEAATIQIRGPVEGGTLTDPTTGQQFRLTGPASAEPGDGKEVTVQGAWSEAEDGQVIAIGPAQPAEN